VKNKLFWVYALTIVTNSCWAQTFGIRLGGNISSQVWKSGSERYTTPSIAAIHIGTNLNIRDSDKISTQIELTYSEFGFGEVESGNGQSVGPYKMDYLKFGCAIKVHPIENLNIHFGPELGFQITKDKTYLNNGDFGVFAGIEKFFTRNVGIGGRYYLGFSDLNQDPELKQKNRSIQFSLLLRINSKQLTEVGI